MQGDAVLPHQWEWQPYQLSRLTHECSFIIIPHGQDSYIFGFKHDEPWVVISEAQEGYEDQSVQQALRPVHCRNLCIVVYRTRAQQRICDAILIRLSLTLHGICTQVYSNGKKIDALVNDALEILSENNCVLNNTNSGQLCKNQLTG